MSQGKGVHIFIQCPPKNGKRPFRVLPDRLKTGYGMSKSLRHIERVRRL